jgi:hypothetical protein
MPKSFCSALIMDADYGETGWEIVFRYNEHECEAAYTDLSDTELSDVVGEVIAQLLIKERDRE